MNRFSLSALVAAGLLAGGLTTSASAADLGGDCCADLEERIAELEATTARKGNRKVSLTVSGWVGQQVMFWDDGVENNVYVHDLGTTLGSHFKFTGAAQINSEWSAGYVLHIEAISSDSLTINQDRDNGPAALTGRPQDAQVLQSYWFLKSERLGKLGVGLQSQATDNLAILVDGSGSLVPANWVAFDVNSFFIRDKATGNLTDVTWGAAGPCAGMGGAWGDCNGIPRNVVRYDTPTFFGFSASTSAGEDDMWDVAVRYAGEHGRIKVAAAAGYNETTDADMGAADNEALRYFQAGLYVQDIPTGLFAMANYGYLDSNEFSGESETWYVKAGLRRKWFALGHTVLYGEYLNNEADGGRFVAQPDFFIPTSSSSNLDVWGLGVVQEIDAAAMSVWVKYRNLEFDDNSGVSYDDFHYVGAGALINF